MVPFNSLHHFDPFLLSFIGTVFEALDLGTPSFYDETGIPKILNTMYVVELEGSCCHVMNNPTTSAQFFDHTV
jgi:hypothetical protein